MVAVAERSRWVVSMELLHQYVASPDVVDALTAQLDHSWGDVRAGQTAIAELLAELSTVLGSATGHRAAMARQRAWSAVIAGATPYNLGAAAGTAGRCPRSAGRYRAGACGSELHCCPGGHDASSACPAGSCPSTWDLL